MGMEFYDINVKDAKGNIIQMSEYAGKVLLIVNTATECGFTPQYKALQELYEQFRGKGFEILDFPCNQFGHQAPLDSEATQQFCELKYKTTFRLFEKIDVNGENASELYQYLKRQKKGFLNSSIKWNFTKFLIDRNGNVVERFSPTTSPNKIADYINSLL